MLLATLREAAKGTSSVDRLLELALQWLFDRSLLIPAQSTLREICVRAAGDTAAWIYQSICHAVPIEKRNEWAAVLLTTRKDGRTVLEWLQRATKRRSAKNRKDMFEKHQYLSELGVAEV